MEAGLDVLLEKPMVMNTREARELIDVRSATVWQDWGPKTIGLWRQNPELSGGGFMFETGAHTLNTICDLAGEDFVEVAASLDTRDRPVDVQATIMGRLESGGLVTISACGETIPSCESEIWIFCTERIIRTGQWGERLLIQKDREEGLLEIPLEKSDGVRDQFTKILRGEMENPCPPEIGLRLAKLWDAVKTSAARDGSPVNCASL